MNNREEEKVILWELTKEKEIYRKEGNTYPNTNRPATMVTKLSKNAPSANMSCPRQMNTLKTTVPNLIPNTRSKRNPPNTERITLGQE